MTDVYQKLAIHLDNLPAGFPATDTGIEIRILRRLFSSQEARIAVALTMLPEPTAAIAARLGMDAGQLAPQLDKMSRKGLIFRISKAEPLYMAAQFVIGIWEYHVNDLDPDLIEDFNAYAPFLIKRWNDQKTKQLRVIPISKSLSPGMEIMPYEAAEEIIKTQSRIVLSPCICRKEQKMVGAGCDNLLEACLSFGSAARYYEDNGLGRRISREEALATLQKGIESGLVLQPGNSQRVVNICMCCGCCCQILKNIKKLPYPAKIVNSNYHATIDQQACVGCGICQDRCHMDAIALENVAQVDLNRCIGCGVCVPACDARAISLCAKPLDEKWIPPVSLVDTYLNMARERGLM